MALSKLPTALEMMNLLVNHMFCLHGIPLDIVSDSWTQFTYTQLWRSFYRALRPSMSVTSGYHPQTNWQAKLANQDLEAVLHCVKAQNPSSWRSHLPWIEHAHTSQSSAATGMPPFECFLSYLTSLFASQEEEIAVPSVQAHLRHCNKIWKDARVALLHSMDRNMCLANRHWTTHPTTNLARKIVFVPKTFHLKRALKNFPLAILVPMTLSASSILQWLNSNCLVP